VARGSPIRVGIVGAGYIAGFAHLPVFSQLSDSTTVVALCDKELSETTKSYGRYVICGGH
jgi:predicted dehydrogenase